MKDKNRVIVRSRCGTIYKAERGCLVHGTDGKWYYKLFNVFCQMKRGKSHYNTATLPVRSYSLIK